MAVWSHGATVCNTGIDSKDGFLGECDLKTLMAMWSSKVQDQLVDVQRISPNFVHLEQMKCNSAAGALKAEGDMARVTTARSRRSWS